MQGAQAWDRAPEGEGEAVSHTQVGVDTYPRSAGASRCCQLGVLSDIKLLVSKGGVKKSELSCPRKERVKS